jgi:putative hydroxymethylpyrimidine transport system substrate-binding protein
MEVWYWRILRMLGKSCLALLGILLALTLAVTACGGGEPEQVSVRLALDWFPNANHAGLYTAVEKGYFEDENLDVEIYTPADPSSILQTVASGADDFGINYQPDLLLARAQGVPVMSVAALVQHPLNSVQTLKASGIARPSGLAGKTVGYPGIPINEPLLETMLKFDGVSGGLDEVELVNVGFNLSETLISGQVDACIGCYFSYESIKMENEGFPVEVIRMEQWGVPDYYELVVVTNEETLAERSDVVQRFVRAVIKGYEEAAADPGAAVDILVALGGDDIDEAIDRPGAELLAPLWKEGDTPVGWQTSEKWTGFADWMHENGIIEEPLDGSEAFTNEFVE